MKLKVELMRRNPTAHCVVEEDIEHGCFTAFLAEIQKAQIERVMADGVPMYSYAVDGRGCAKKLHALAYAVSKLGIVQSAIAQETRLRTPAVLHRRQGVVKLSVSVLEQE